MRISELENIRRSLYEYQLQLRVLHGSLENQNREFHSQARQDALTGCHNRRAYEEDWQRFREEVKTVPQGVAFLLFDCDRFKTINDTYGHAKGDRVLTIISDALVMALRANDRLYRLGGDEFATFLSRTTPAQAKQIAQRCQSCSTRQTLTTSESRACRHQYRHCLLRPERLSTSTNCPSRPTSPCIPPSSRDATASPSMAMTPNAPRRRWWPAARPARCSRPCPRPA
jgi:diguanylate cyclase (GGDEF)-like protein